MTTLGLIGAGHIGSQVARLAVASGLDVVISNSRGPETLAPLVQELGPKARAATALEAAKAGDIMVVTIPLKAISSVPIEPLVDCGAGAAEAQRVPHQHLTRSDRR
jgi:predicted dinucleotide-binding enzyme